MLREQLTWYVLLRADFTDNELGVGNPSGHRQLLRRRGRLGQLHRRRRRRASTCSARSSRSRRRAPSSRSTPTRSTDYPVDVLEAVQRRHQPARRRPAAKSSACIDGKYIDTTWDFDGCGYYWADECQTRIGYFVDKTVALDVLSQSQAYFTGRDTSTDVRKYAIGYILPFKKQMRRSSARCWRATTRSLAPRAVDDRPDDHVVQLPELGAERANPARGQRGDLIDPAGGFTLQLYAGVYGLSAFPTTFDHVFIDTTQIFVVGNGEAPVSGRDALAARAPSDPAAAGRRNGGTQGVVHLSPMPTTRQDLRRALGRRAPTDRLTATPLDGDQTTLPQRHRACACSRRSQSLQTQRTARRAPAPARPRRRLRGQGAGAYEKFKQNIEVMRSLHNAFGYGQLQDRRAVLLLKPR